MENTIDPNNYEWIQSSARFAHKCTNDNYNSVERCSAERGRGLETAGNYIYYWATQFRRRE